MVKDDIIALSNHLHIFWICLMSEKFPGKASISLRMTQRNFYSFSIHRFQDIFSYQTTHLLMVLIVSFQVVGTLYTHHQKCVIVDSQASGNNRKITSFIGGLDLCDGRYDTPEHRLFRDLDTVFKDDYHNPTFPVGIHFLLWK